MVEATAKACPRRLLLGEIHARLLRVPLLPSFNLAIRVLSKSTSLRRHSLLLYAHMTRLSLSPDNFTFPFLLNSCAALSTPLLGSEIHSRALRSGHLPFLHVSNALIDMYGKCALLPCARRLFDEMLLRDLVTFNALLGAHARDASEMPLARRLFEGMSQRNVISWNAMVVGYANSGELASARELFDRMPTRNVVSWNAMIIGYVRNAEVDSARALFDQMPVRNLISWAVIISGYAANGRPHEALELFREMDRNGIVPDAATMIGVISSSAQLGDGWLATSVASYVDRHGIEKNERILTGLVDMHAKCGNAEEACRLFEDIRSKSAFSYTALITGLAAHGYAAKALEYFNKMQMQGIKPDSVTYIGILNVCSHNGLVEEGMRLWDMMINYHNIEPQSEHFACLVDMLGRAGKLKDAHELVRSMPKAPHASALGALLSACRSYGEVETAESVAEELFELEPYNTGNYMLLWSIYAAREQWDKAGKLRERMGKRGIKKLPGSSWM